ncbi:MAG TPA: Crp/Fnr family transcriptional regulator [Ornithinibacter sp.]|nr:Crp/Fnr family transcriptional regulator [Ornithinibacter sp.]
MDWGLLQGLPDPDRRVVLGSTHRRRFARGEVVFHEDDPADTVHFVAEGRLAARRSTTTGETVTFSILGPGDAFGEMAMLSVRARRTSTVVALEPAVTHTLSFAEFERLCASHPGVERLLVDLLAERVSRLSDHLVEALHVPADQRVVRRLSELCERYGPPDARAPVAVPLTQTDIGDLAGASRATTNRVLRRLAADGVVVLHRGSVDVRDRAALARRSAPPTSGRA